MRRNEPRAYWPLAPREPWEPKPTRWDLEVDPDLVLPVRERYRRADAAREAFFVEQGLKARKRNRERRAAEAGTPVPPMTDEERRLVGRLGGLRATAKRDAREATAAARAAGAGRFERQVDPDGVLEPKERARRAKAAEAAYYAQLCLASVEARDREARRSKSDPKTLASKETQRRLRARIGAYMRLANNDLKKLSEPMREGARKHLRALLESLVPADVPDREQALRDAETAYFRELSGRRWKR